MFGYEMNQGLKLRHTIGYGGSETNLVQYRQIQPIIAHEGDFLRGEFQIAHQGSEYRKFVASALEDMSQFEVVGTTAHGLGLTGGNQANFNPDFLEHGHAKTVATMEGLDLVATMCVSNGAIGQYAIDIKEQELDGFSTLKTGLPTERPGLSTMPGRGPFTKEFGELAITGVGGDSMIVWLVHGCNTWWKASNWWSKPST